MNNNLLMCSNLVKKYGNHLALDNLSLSVKKGEIVAVVGPNGAGKTTLIKCIVGLLNYNRGEIRINGMEPSFRTKQDVAYLPDEKFLYQWMTIRQTIDYFNVAFEDFDKNKAMSIISGFGLSENQLICECSKGMQEKLNISLVLSRNAKLFVLDEPLAAVDPLTRDIIINMIKKHFNNSDAAMLISTHLIRDVESLFTNVAFITEGKVVLSNSVKELHDKYAGDLEDIFKETMK